MEAMRMEKHVLVPKERLAVVIGDKGKTKRLIERKTTTSITVDDVVVISGDAVNVVAAEEIIAAIGRGFAPERALRLLDEDMIMVVIPLPSDGRALRRVRSRLIGTGGKARRRLEAYTDTAISVYGKTATIIGAYDDAEDARLAVEKIVKGFQHMSVYRFLEERRKTRDAKNKALK